MKVQAGSLDQRSGMLLYLNGLFRPSQVTPTESVGLQKGGSEFRVLGLGILRRALITPETQKPQPLNGLPPEG